MKRLISLVLAIVLVSSMFAVAPMQVFATEDENGGTPPVTDGNTTEGDANEGTNEDPEEVPEEPEDDGFKTSAECIALLKEYEGFCKYPIYDYGQYSVGYGTRCPDDMYYHYMQYGITEEEAETLLRNFLDYFENEIDKFVARKNLTLSQNQLDALLMFSYNCGTNWMTQSNGTFYNAIVKGADKNDLIRAFALWCSAGDEVLPALLRRRLAEANMYLNGVYSSTLPSTYCYVQYNANGGTTSPRTQGYSTEWQVEPFPVPERDDCTFVGWYTERVGGTKVNYLDRSHHNTTLYAHWLDADGNTPGQLTGPVTVKVTGQWINIRSGPGTNYTKVGEVLNGDTLVITDTCDNGGYTWGKFEKGWVALCYTNYDIVIHQGPSTEPPVESEPEEPDDTQQSQTKVTGTVKVQGVLNIRKGPGTGYAIVGELRNQQKVEILEQKMVGSMNWGRIAQGWISLSYVVLDEVDDSTDDTTGDNTTDDDNDDTTTDDGNDDTTTDDGNDDTNDDTTGDNNTGDNTTDDTTNKEEESDKVEDNGGNTGSDSSIIHTGVVVNCSALRIRTGPGVGYSIAGSLYPGTKLSFTELRQVGNMTWGKMDKGWVSLDYIKLDSLTDGKSVTGTVKVSDWLKIRSNPSTSGAIRGYLGAGAKVEILEQRVMGSSVWGRIDKGWICLDYVVLDTIIDDDDTTTDDGNDDTTTDDGNDDTTTDGGNDDTTTDGGNDDTTTDDGKDDTTTDDGKDDSTEDSDSTTAVYGKVKVNDFLNIRATAGSTGKWVGSYTPNTRVQILETKTVNGTEWGRTDRGWVSMTYIVLESDASTEQKDIRIVTADLLNVRKSASTTAAIVGGKYRNAKVEILETKTVNGMAWGRIAEGWIALSYTKKA